MKRLLEYILGRVPIPSVREAIRERREIMEWDRAGRPAPPPHAIKQQAIRAYAKKFGLKIFVETGTFRGAMVEAMKKYFSRIYSIELGKDLYEESKERFAGDERITIIHGDSGVELGKLVPKLNQPALFWLDGHYSAGITARGEKDTPILEELTHIFNSGQKGHVILIDDVRCFDPNPAYPNVDDLLEFIKQNRPDSIIEIENDSIRII